MKNTLLISLLCMGLIACSSGGTKPQSVNESSQKDVVEVLYFHSKKRCVTCNAIENLSKEVLNAVFADKMSSDKVRFRVVDITSDKDVTEHYQIAWSSLLVVDFDAEGNEQITDMTKFAFSSAKTAPEMFKAGLVEQVNLMLNN